MDFRGKACALTQQAFEEGAERLGVDAAKLWAVFEIESKRCGFWNDRRPVILFERHIFHKKTGGKFDASHPDISNPVQGGYGATGQHQYDRLAEAVKLDRGAALESTSWGLGQVMGFNAKPAGFKDAEDMVAQMCDGEDAQLSGMVGFLKSNGLDRSLRVENWAGFARGYNGPDYAKNAYDVHLKGAYAKYASGPLPDFEVRETQLLLNYLGYGDLVVDGWAASATLRAVNHYLADRKKPEVQSVTPELTQALRADVAKLS